MHPIILLTPLILSLPSPAHATPTELITSTAALTKRADAIDAVVVALTTAQQIPPSLQNLTTALTTTLTASTPTAPTTDPATASDVLDTYGLFANTIWELMDDYAYQKTNLIGVFDMKTDMYSQLTSFDGAFLDLSTFTTAVLNDAADKIDMGYYVGNTTLTIELALKAFAP